MIICVFVLIPFTGLYTFIGGLWGVLVTDLFQFALKMTMIIVLAWVAVAKIGGMGALQMQLHVVAESTRASGTEISDPTAFLPDFHLGLTTNALWTLPVLTFIVYLGMQWWLAWYPGAEPGGGGYVAQRMFSAKDEKNSLGATLWFNIAHYALRPWPWVVTGLVALVVYSPHGGLHPSADFAANPEQGYVMVLRDYLPPALRGLMVAAFLAAFMSTIGTQLNWGSSYLVNDLYKRFFVRDATEKHYVMISKIFTVLLVLGSGYTATQAGVDQPGMATGAEHRLRHGCGLHPALVLVAHQRVERDRGDGGCGADDDRVEPRFVHRQRFAGVREDRADHGTGDDHRVGDCDVRDAARVG